MPRFIRRGRLAPAPLDLGAEPPPSSSRRAFLRTSGGVATVAIVPAAILASDADATSAHPANGVAIAGPTTAQPAQPVMAYVHDAKAGTVVIMSGTTERTVKDRELVRRLTVVPKKPRRKRAKRRPARKPTNRKQG